MELRMAPDARRSSIGELCRRATPLALRALVPLGLAYAVGAVVGVVTSLQNTSYADQRAFFDVLGQLVHPGGFERLQHFSTRQRAPQGPQWALLWSFLVYPLVTASMIAIASARYRGDDRTAAAGFVVGLRRYLPVVGVSVLWLVAVLAAVIVLAVVATVLLIAVGVGLVLCHVHVSRAGVPGFIAIVTVLSIAAWLAASVAGIATYQVGVFACVVEGLGSWRAFAGSFARTFGGDGLRRTLLAGAVLTAVSATDAALGFVAWGVCVALLHSVVAAAVFGVLSGAAVAIWTVAFSAAYFDDLRARETRLGAPSSVPTG